MACAPACKENAICAMAGSGFECVCKQGYSGNADSCQGMGLQKHISSSSNVVLIKVLVSKLLISNIEHTQVFLEHIHDCRV